MMSIIRGFGSPESRRLSERRAGDEDEPRVFDGCVTWQQAQENPRQPSRRIERESSMGGGARLNRPVRRRLAAAEEKRVEVCPQFLRRA